MAARRKQRARRPAERFRILAEHVAELIVEIDSQGRIAWASPGCREVLGYEPEELLELDPLELVHGEDRALVERTYQRLGPGRTVQSTHRARHRDGSWRWIQDTVRCFLDDDGEHHLVAVGRDITGQRQLEATLARQIEIQGRVAELSRRLWALPAEDLANGIRDSLGVAAGLADADRTLLLVTRGGETPIGTPYLWQREACRGEAPRTDTAVLDDFAWSARSLAGGEYLHVPNLDSLGPEAAGERRDMERRGVRSLLAIPLRCQDQVIGFQTFECLDEEHFWTEQAIDQLRLVGEILASAIERHRVERALVESRERLERARDADAMRPLAQRVADEITELLAHIQTRSEALAGSSCDGDVRADLSELAAAARQAAELAKSLRASDVPDSARTPLRADPPDED